MRHRGDNSLHDTPQASCIPTSYSRLYARLLNIAEGDIPRLLQDTRLSAEQLVDKSAYITAKQQIQIIQNGFDMTGDQTIGLRLGCRLTPTTHGALGYLVCSSPNLLAMLTAFKTYLPTRVDFCHLELRQNADYLEYSLTFDEEMSTDIQRVLSETLAGVILQCVKHIIGRQAENAEVSFTHKEPEYSEQYADFLPGKIKFSASHLVMKIPAKLCELPNLFANDGDYLAAQNKCQQLLDEIPSPSDSWEQRVQKLLLSSSVPVHNEEAAAAMLYTSKRTLARRLKMEGSSFRKLRSEALKKQACELLSNTKMSVDDIAEKLNYQDTSNFRRAFKSWTQMTPDQYRRQPDQESPE